MYKSFIGNVGRKSGKNMLLRKLRRREISNRQSTVTRTAGIKIDEEYSKTFGLIIDKLGVVF